MLGNIPPFVGFSTVKDSALVLPTFSLPGTENPESVLDVNFQLVLKKMYKKDSTTKLKVSFWTSFMKIKTCNLQPLQTLQLVIFYIFLT